MNFIQSISAGLEVADMAWDVKCREEDLTQRSIDNERRRIDDARRSVDEKSQQLKAVSHLSALVAGFAMVVMVELNIPEDLNMVLLVMFGTTAALVIGLMLFAMLNCTLMLVAILKYDCIRRDIPFDDFWRKRCSADWVYSFNAFAIGLTLFMALLAQLGWVTFHSHPSRNTAASIVTAVAVTTGTIWLIHTKRKWGDFVQHSSTKFFDEKHIKQNKIGRKSPRANRSCEEWKDLGGKTLPQIDEAITECKDPII
mmetsp:Transcript_12200/g.15818  ORF Transcript_12200/g.15818 Transcript_12200/m.15818 type:complete len:255 (-) Transcript_12200:166-930(-)